MFFLSSWPAEVQLKVHLSGYLPKLFCEQSLIPHGGWVSEGLARPAGALLATGAGPGAAREAGLPLWAGPGAVPSSGLVGLGGDSPKLPGAGLAPMPVGGSRPEPAGSEALRARQALLAARGRFPLGDLVARSKGVGSLTTAQGGPGPGGARSPEGASGNIGALGTQNRAHSPASQNNRVTWTRGGRAWSAARAWPGSSRPWGAVGVFVLVDSGVGGLCVLT